MVVFVFVLFFVFFLQNLISERSSDLIGLHPTRLLCVSVGFNVVNDLFVHKIIINLCLKRQAKSIKDILLSLSLWISKHC